MPGPGSGCSTAAPSALSVSCRPTAVEAAAQPLRGAPGVGEHDRRPVPPDQLEDARLEGRPDRRPGGGAGRGRAGNDHAGPLAGEIVRQPERGRSALVRSAHVLDRDLHVDLDGLGCRRAHHRHLAGAAEEAGRPPPPAARSRTGRSAAPGGPAGRRAAPGSARGARRAWSPATACTSSTITVRTDRSDSRARLVSSRNSDSGVVIRMSGGRLANRRRSSAGVSPLRMAVASVGHRDAEPVGGLPDAGQRGAQVALDVDRQRLERADVEHPAAGLLGRQRLAQQPVDRPEERRQRLARTGRGDDEGVLAAGDRPPGLVLSPGGRRERALEPRPGHGRERGQGRSHPHSLRRGYDIRPAPTVGCLRATPPTRPSPSRPGGRASARGVRRCG